MPGRMQKSMRSIEAAGFVTNDAATGDYWRWAANIFSQGHALNQRVVIRGVTKKLGTAIRALPGRFVMAIFKAANGDAAAVESIFQFRDKDRHSAQEECNFLRTAPRADMGFFRGSHFHGVIDNDVGWG